MPEQHIEIIRYDCGWGCRDYGCEDGPDAVDAASLTAELEKLGHRVTWHPSLNIRQLGRHDEINDKDAALPLVAEASKRLSDAVQKVVEAGRVPVILGGDHSSAIGTWSGIIAAHNAFEEFGLIWLDAHLDAHTPETAHEGKWGGWWHGMPVACLTGEGVDELTAIATPRPKINMAHFSLYGARSYEPSEDEFMQRHNARVYEMPEIKTRGFAETLAEGIKNATDGTKGFGLSVDLDGFDPADAPGVGTNEKNGLDAEETLKALSGLAAHPKFRGLEIVEYNPHKDKDGKTARLINGILLSVFRV
ncbi:MAG: arginase [Micavibrio sp.]|nr:MAG: arginase [Micavibrio sp.]